MRSLLDLGCGSTEQLHWLSSPCVANFWSCQLCRRPHRLCTAPPPRETQVEDLTLHTLRTLIQQNIWNNGGGGCPDIELMDVLTDEDPTTRLPRPPWRAPTWPLPDPGAGPHDLRPRPRTVRRRAMGQSTLRWQCARQLGPRHHHEPQQLPHHRRHPHHPPPVRLRLAGGGRGIGDGNRPLRPWRRIRGVLPPRWGHDPGGDREADGGLSHIQERTPPTQPPATGTACQTAARPAAAAGHVRQCGSGKDDGQR